MKKLLLALTALLCIGTAFTADAKNEVYVYLDEDENYMFGVLRRVSPNGQWVIGSDETFETGSIIINTNTPDDYIMDEDGQLLDVADNGLAVGAWYEKVGGAKYKRAAIYHDGVWERLPLPQQIIGQSYAVAISADLKTIAGHGMCKNDDPDEPGKYFPMVWKLDEATGTYQLHKLYNALWLPGTFGFYVQTMTPDAKLVCGLQCLDMGDTVVAILDLETGEYTTGHQLEYREYEWSYGDLWGIDTGLFVDGLIDGSESGFEFNGRLNYANNRYVFGQRSMAFNISDDGLEGEISTTATVYDIATREFMDIDTSYGITCGISPNQYFTNNGLVYEGDESMPVTQKYHLGHAFDFVYGIDQSGRVLVGSHISLTPWGEYYESPVLAILDEAAFAGVENLRPDLPEASIQLSGRTLTVTGATQVSIYAANGALVSHSQCVTLAPGVYVVVADGASHKIIVE